MTTAPKWHDADLRKLYEWANRVVDATPLDPTPAQEGRSNALRAVMEHLENADIELQNAEDWA